MLETKSYEEFAAQIGTKFQIFDASGAPVSEIVLIEVTERKSSARQGVVFGTFTANADGGGLRINANPNTVTINNTNFTGNIAQEDGGAIKTLDAFVTITGGTKTLGDNVSLLGSLTVGAGTTLDAGAGNFALNLNGNFINNGTFLPQGGTVGFTGSAAQTIGGANATDFNNLQINNAAGVTCNFNSTAANLTLTNGNVSMGANTLTLTGTASRAARHVIGNLRKIYGAPENFTYPVGAANGYSPVIAGVTALAVASSNLTVRANEGTAPGSVPLNDATTLDRYWTLLETGSLTADVTFKYLQTDVDGNENNYRVIRVAGGFPQAIANGAPCPGVGSPCVDAGADTIFVGGVFEFSDWTAGELAPTSAAASLGGRVTNAKGRGLAKITVRLDGGDLTAPRYAQTDWTGRFRFEAVPTGATYIVTLVSNLYKFAPDSKVEGLTGDVAEVDFVGRRSN